MFIPAFLISVSKASSEEKPAKKTVKRVVKAKAPEAAADEDKPATKVEIVGVEKYANDLPKAALAAFRRAFQLAEALSGEDAAAVRSAVQSDMNVVDIFGKLRQIFQEDLTDSENEKEEELNTAQSQKQMPSAAMAFLEECGVDLDFPKGL